MAKKRTARLLGDLGVEVEAAARVNEALVAEVQRVSGDGVFTKTARALIERDNELLVRLAK